MTDHKVWCSWYLRKECDCGGRDSKQNFNVAVATKPEIEEGLCQSCKEWVVPEEEFCPICGQEFIDIKDRDEEV